MLSSFLFALSPVILIFVLVIFFKTDILNLSIISFLYTIILTYYVFKTSTTVILLSCIDGIVTTLPILLVVYTGILLSQFLLQKGSLQRFTALFSKGLKGKFQKAFLLTAGFVNFFEGAGVIAEPVAAPMLYSAGIAPEGSVALSILGYSGLMHLALAGVIVTVLSNVTLIPAEILSYKLVYLSFPATVFLFLSIPFLIGESQLLLKKFPIMVITGIIINIFAFLCIKFISYSISAMIGGLGGIIFLYFVYRIKPVVTKKNFRDIVPFLSIFIFLSSINLIKPVKNLVFEKFVIKISVIPFHAVSIRPFYSAYLYLFICFLISYKIFAEENDKISDYLMESIKKSYKPVISMALFGALGSVIAFSGLDTTLTNINNSNNIAFQLATGFITYTGKLYPLFAPLLGWIGTFLTGYGIASIMLFAKLQLKTAMMLGISKSLLVSSLTVGASVGSISSPFKIALAAPLCNAVGKESNILRKTIPIGMAVSALIGLFNFLPN
jgi:lactate permease